MPAAWRPLPSTSPSALHRDGRSSILNGSRERTDHAALRVSGSYAGWVRRVKLATHAMETADTSYVQHSMKLLIPWLVALPGRPHLKLKKDSPATCSVIVQKLKEIKAWEAMPSEYEAARRYKLLKRTCPSSKKTLTVEQAKDLVRRELAEQGEEMMDEDEAQAEASDVLALSRVDANEVAAGDAGESSGEEDSCRPVEDASTDDERPADATADLRGATLRLTELQHATSVPSPSGGHR